MMLGTVGRSLELYFIDGKPDGMQTAEVFNWTGHVLLTPRTRIKVALERDKASYTGVYLLLGDKDGEPTAYIGEGEDISSRIRSHEQQKDWWTQAALITTAGNALNKAHVKYLESRLIEIGRNAGRVELENDTTPQRPSLSEADVAKMETFLEYLLIVLPALRIDLFLDYTKSPVPMQTETEVLSDGARPVFEMSSRRHGLRARAVLNGDDFTVIQGSQARLQWEGRGMENSTYARLHAELLRNGVLVADGDHCVFAKDYAFRSPSAAASVVHGRQARGTTEWKLEGTGTTYQQWEARQIGAHYTGAT
jgi:hypothetical protein